MNNGNYLPLVKKGPRGTKGSDFFVLTKKYWKYFAFLIHWEKKPTKPPKMDVITHGECHTSSRAVPDFFLWTDSLTKVCEIILMYMTKDAKAIH